MRKEAKLGGAVLDHAAMLSKSIALTSHPAVIPLSITLE